MPTLDLVKDKDIELGFYPLPAVVCPSGGNSAANPDGGGSSVPAEGITLCRDGRAVGAPGGEDGDLRANWVLWDRDCRMIEFRETSYLQ